MAGRRIHTNLQVEALEARWVPSATFPLTSVPELHSLPGAFAKLYLDFDGDFTAQWGSQVPGTTPAYDSDGDATSFSAVELDAIHEIWGRIAEKFSPFNINVTTVDPGNLNNRETLKVVFGGDGAWAGGFGGIGFLNGFSADPAFANDNIVWVFPQNLAGGLVSAVAEAGAHEAGHGFGLDHQRLFDANGVLLNEYNPGDSRRAPIMGQSTVTAAERATWIRGLRFWPNGVQDDLAILSNSDNGFGYRPDDFPAVTDLPGSLSVRGVIEQLDDADTFRFSSPGGLTSFAVRPVALGPMLDADLELRDADGNLVELADNLSLSEIINIELTPGEYTVTVRGHGDYGDLGQYTLDVHFNVARPTLKQLRVAPDPVKHERTFRLSAQGIRDEGRVVRAEFYRDVNGDGVLDPFTDAFLGSTSQIRGGTASLEVASNDLPVGHQRYFVRLLDDTNTFSDTLMARGTIEPVLSLGIDPDPVARNGTVTLDARGVLLLDTEVARVKFFRDANGNGRLDGRDRLLGSDSDGADGWTVSTSTAGFRPTALTPRLGRGEQVEVKPAYPLTVTYFAVAVGADGSRSNVATTTGLVGLPPRLRELSASTDRVMIGDPFTLTAEGLSDPDGKVLRVQFFIDSNLNGVLDSDDLSLGVAEGKQSGFQLSVETRGYLPRAHKFFARAQDDLSLWSEVAEVVVELIGDPPRPFPV